MLLGLLLSLARMGAFHSLLIFAVALARASDDPGAFDWYALPPSENLTWTACFDGFQCARLSVPLDHAVPNGPQAHIALQLYPATDRANYSGTIFINPGGPGNSGTQFVIANAAKFAQMFGPTFDVLGFDPRGVGATTPRADCFDSVEEEEAFSAKSKLVLKDGDGSIPLVRAQAQVLAQVCARKLAPDEQGAGRFMDTKSVATDMTLILQKLGQEKMLYWGMSYGTVLGQYFAALFPEKVGRMVLDGIADGMNWQAGDVIPFIADADKVMNQFYIDCVKAGATKCAVAERTPELVEERVARIVDSLADDPIPIPDSVTGTYVYTTDDVLLRIISSFYSPLTGFPDLAQWLGAIEARNASFFSQQSFTSSEADLSPWLRSNQAQFAIECADWAGADGSLAGNIATVRNATGLSKWLGPIWSIIPVKCGAWVAAIRPKDRFAGAVEADLANPILGISNRFDAVTPLAGAEAVAARFTGMRILVHDTVGHTAFGSLSGCVADAVRRYMTIGELPEEGTICLPDEVPLLGAANTS